MNLQPVQNLGEAWPRQETGIVPLRLPGSTGDGLTLSIHPLIFAGTTSGATCR